MLNPGIIAMIMGGVQAGGSMFGSFSQNEAIKEQNKRLQAQMDKNENDFQQSKKDLTEANKSLSSDFLTNYITIRDANKAEGLRGEYGRAKSEFTTTLQNLMSQKNQLNSQLASQMQGTQSNAGIIGGGLMQGVGAGMSAYNVGQQMDLSNKMLSGMSGNKPMQSGTSFTDYGTKMLDSDNIENNLFSGGLNKRRW
jgi:hypothetical protein